MCLWYLPVKKHITGLLKLSLNIKYLKTADIALNQYAQFLENLTKLKNSANSEVISLKRNQAFI